MNPKALIPLVVGLGIAGVAAKLGLDFVKKASGNQVQTVSLWTPVQDIQRGVAINEAMLKPLPFPANVAPHGALSDVQKIVGRVPHTGAPAGVPILDSMLLPPGVSPGVRVPPGFRAVAVKIDEGSGVDNHLEPGRFVDVVGVFTARRANKAETIAKTLLENVEVAAVGDRLAPDAPTPGVENDGKRSQRERAPRAVTLLVHPEQVPILHLAEQKGKIKLSMRGLSDQQTTNSAADYDTAQLFGEEDDQPAEPQVAWGDKFGSFISSLWKSAEAPAKPVEAVVEAPQPNAPAQPEWVMAIYNGDERRVLGWTDMNSFQPIELSSEGPNIFQEEPRLPPQVPQPYPPAGQRDGADPGQSSGTPASGASASDQQNEESQTQSEPQELFE